jgi:hypothetical protein
MCVLTGWYCCGATSMEGLPNPIGVIAQDLRKDDVLFPNVHSIRYVQQGRKTRTL